MLLFLHRIVVLRTYRGLLLPTEERGLSVGMSVCLSVSSVTVGIYSEPC